MVLWCAGIFFFSWKTNSFLLTLQGTNKISLIICCLKSKHFCTLQVWTFIMHIFDSLDPCAGWKQWVRHSFIRCTVLVCNVEKCYWEIILGPVYNELLIQVPCGHVSKVLALCKGTCAVLSCWVLFSGHKMHFCYVLGVLFWIPHLWNYSCVSLGCCNNVRIRDGKF